MGVQYEVESFTAKIRNAASRVTTAVTFCHFIVFSFRPLYGLIPDLKLCHIDNVA